MQSEVFGYFYVSASSHEIGHNLGQSHSDVGTTVYADYSDIMGNFWNVSEFQALTFNAPHLVNLGWVDPGEVQSIDPTVSTNTTYTINSLESNTGLRILTIDKPSTQPDAFYISMRQAIGLDTNMPAKYLGGANIHIWNGVYNKDTNLASVLTDGATYTDAADGITIQQLSHTASTVTVNIITTGLNTCVRAAPNITTSPGSPPGVWSAPGSPATITLNLGDKDTAACGSTAVTLGTSLLPAGWIGTYSPSASITLTPGQTQSVSLIVKPPSTAVPSATPYAFGYVVQSPNLYLAYQYYYYVISPACTQYAPTIVPTPTSATVAAGTLETYSFKITNNDTSTCNSSTFVLTPQTPTGWTSSLASNLTLGPGVSGNMTSTITSPLNAPSGTTTVSMQLTDSQTSIHNTNTSVGYTIPAPACVRAAPALSLSPSSRAGPAGGQLSYIASLTNQDSSSCTASAFTLAPSVPSGWTGNLALNSFVLAPGASQQSAFLVTSAANAALQNYTVSLAGKDNTLPGVHDSLPAQATYTVNSLPPPPPPQSPPPSTDMSISATRVRSGHSSTLNWYVSSGLATGITCSVSPASMIQSGGPTSISGSDTITSWGSSSSPITAQTTPITGTVTFTLTCTNSAGAATSQSTNTGLVPAYQDI